MEKKVSIACSVDICVWCVIELQRHMYGIKNLEVYLFYLCVAQIIFTLLWLLLICLFCDSLLIVS